MSQPALDFGDEPYDDPSNPTYSVCELGDAINAQLARRFDDGVWVRGEISGWSKSAAGHIYFDLVETDPDGNQLGKLKVAFFAGSQHGPRLRFKKAGLRLGEGLKVRVFGALEFYARGGQISLRMTNIDPRYTLGEMLQARDQVVRTLVAAGLFDANRNRPLTISPRRIGVVTSRQSAGWQDFRTELEQSGVAFELVLCDSRVQGLGASEMVAAAVRTLARRTDLDCIVLIRGGGARNELATFDAESVALAIGTSPVPVLTGLGHDVDRSVADEVAHESFKTPTACAADLVRRVREYNDATEQRWAAITALAGRDLLASRAALSDRAHRIARRTHAAVERADERLNTRVDRLLAAPRRQVDLATRVAAQHHERLRRRAPQIVQAETRHLDAVEQRLALLDPVNLLRRGWSITRGPDGTVLRSVDDVAPGDVIRTRLADGELTSQITSDQNEDS